MRDEEFEWDDRKAASNERKHDVSFATARLAFGDPNWMEFDDPDPDEVRYQRLCFYQGRFYVVVYTERDPRFRIISARRATNHEQDIYNDR